MRDAARQERAERLAGRAAEGEVDRAVGQALAAEAAGDLEPSIVPTVRLTLRTGSSRLHRPRVEQRALAELDQRLVQRAVQAVVLRRGPGAAACPRAARARRSIGDEVEPGGLPVVDRLAGVEQLGVADGLVDRAEAQLGQVARAPPRRGTRRR